MTFFSGWVFWKTLGSEMVIRQNTIQAQSALNRAMDRMVNDKASMIISIEGYVSPQIHPFRTCFIGREVKTASYQNIKEVLLYLRSKLELPSCH
jgi:hypothetical protein